MCKGITEADKEIIDILKELFRNKNNEFVDPDDLLLEQIVKWSIYLALLGLLILLPIKIFGNADQSAASSMLSGIVGVAFTLLFIYLNIKSKNPSIIMYVLTWFSLMLSLWVAG
ncbi:hypothetical protein PSH47_03320 [Pseudoalteromonas sp. CST5]|uniref:hypothetical protein n=1 Tax=unclassified Pseudoalteromonas TaxID=194690 RepID=UPI00235977CC|nr:MULTISPECIES: hypothetical protein [unclassified Pseudoalteromonas]MDC9511787.1 hypothetical protein [Pseudoalteromonas sp. CST1]MDC9536023.1 hypothetical protein [Pseudoalteromonas sp. CST3]MDC9540614.1 hypothetical protein [Pseudoalteromonas sp. CST2]MDC9544791.1 hypothetical protein [Pseudoalteromonas sp. CST4]MDC9548200.1 hypothetical protein [Pseudoalteromonas sp. CST5]